MLKNKTKIFLLCSILLIAIIGISSVSAVDDTNDTSVKAQHTNTADVPAINNNNVDNKKVKDVQNTQKVDSKTKNKTKELTKTIEKENKPMKEIITNTLGRNFSFNYAHKIQKGSNLTVTLHIDIHNVEDAFYDFIIFNNKHTKVLKSDDYFLGTMDLEDGLTLSCNFENVDPGDDTLPCWVDFYFGCNEGELSSYSEFPLEFGEVVPEQSNIVVDDVTFTKTQDAVLSYLDTNVTVVISNGGIECGEANVILTVGNESQTKTVTNIGNTSQNVTFEEYFTSTGDKDVSVVIDYLNGTTVTAYTGTVNILANGYMGKSFTNNSNMTNAAKYEGNNTVNLFTLSDYISAKWDEQTLVFDAASNGVVDKDKIVDVLYYVPYTYCKNLNFTVTANNELMDAESHYMDIKGFGTYNYPYGLMVYNLTNVFAANTENTIVLTPGSNNDIGLYGTYLVVVYANSTKRTTIIISEDCDMISTTKSSYGATSDTAISYANYDDLNLTDSVGSQLIVVAGGADNITNVLFNSENLGSLNTAYNNASQLSIFNAELDNLDGDNNLAIQSVNDNLYVYNSILVVKYQEPQITIEPTEIEIGDKVTITVSLIDEIGETDEGKVLFRINDRILRDDNGNVIRADVIGGIATVSDVNITRSWMNAQTTIQALFTGTDTIELFATNPLNVTITKKHATLNITGDTEGKTGQNVTLSVSVTDKNGNLNTGRVSFKINGKTLKSEDGQILYGIVENGVASTVYTIPAKYKAKTYPFIAVFIDTDYERADVQSEFIIKK